MQEINITHDLGVVSLVTQAGLVVQLVLLILILLSIVSWAIIFTKRRQLKAIQKENAEFLELFWNSQNMDGIYEKSDQFTISIVASVFRSGFRELRKHPLDGSRETSVAASENINRSLVRSIQQEVGNIERNVAWLATTASAAPFIGLFGTVWGIMNSFRSISQTGSASLAVVAPGISEALIATAVGLAAAIPAVIAYNQFVNQIKRIAISADCFSQDFLNIVQRSIFSGKKS